MTDQLPRKIAIQPLQVDDPTKGQLHTARRTGVLVRRDYFSGEMYTQENLDTADRLTKDDPSFSEKWQRLPERKRLHAYSDHLKSGLNFLADQISGEIQIEHDDQSVDDWVRLMLKDTGIAVRQNEIVRETMIAGDLFALVLPYPHEPLDEPQVKIQLWEAETVEVDYDPDDWTRIVEVRVEEHRPVVNTSGDTETKRIVLKYGLEFRDYGEALESRIECILTTEMDGEVISREWLGIPVIPWVHFHGEPINLRSSYGEPVIGFQIMESVDRFNAVSQLEFLAIRYNSFGKLAIIGDDVLLRDQAGDYTLAGDVADASVFPGGTDIETLSLDIRVDAYMQHKEQLIDEIFGLLGLERIDSKKISSFGGVSGYALEILNRKTDGTFRRLVDNQRLGMLGLINMAMDVNEYATAEVSFIEEIGEFVHAWWEIDPLDTFPDRQKIIVNYGSAYIVDEVAIRDDFTAGLISRREALRQRGFDKDHIDKVEVEIASQDEKDQESITKAITEGSRFDTSRS